MSMQDTITQKLTDELSPVHLEVINESSNHNVPEGSESHFKLVVVSEAFEGERLLNCHRKVYGILEHEMQNGIHALTMHTMTPDEWFEKAGKTPDSPLCMGGGKD